MCFRCRAGVRRQALQEMSAMEESVRSADERVSSATAEADGELENAKERLRDVEVTERGRMSRRDRRVRGREGGR